MALKFAVNNSLSAVTSLPTAIPTGSMTLLQTQTASSSATIDFTSNIDSTYDVYVFKLIDIHLSQDDVEFAFNMSSDGGSNYNVTKTTTFFRTYHNEADTATALEYRTANDLAQSTSDQNIFTGLGADNDQCGVGIITLYNPSSTTFVKHFMMEMNMVQQADYNYNFHIAGYANTTSAINAVRFKPFTGNIDSGVIKLYGIN